MKDREYKCCPLYMPYKKEEGRREKWKERYLILHEQRRQGLFPLQWRRAVPTHTRAFISLTAAGCYIHLQRSLTVSTTTLSFFHSLCSFFIFLLLSRCKCDCTVGEVGCKNPLEKMHHIWYVLHGLKTAHSASLLHKKGSQHGL